MSFDINRLTECCLKAINAFAKQHQNEVFYAFAVDANMLCFNSEEAAAEILTTHRTKWELRNREVLDWSDLNQQDHADLKFLERLDPRLTASDQTAKLVALNRSRAKQRAKGNPYNREADILELRRNTGDWKYQGFAAMNEADGFDSDAYQAHYYAAMESEAGTAPQSPYAIAMKELIANLVRSEAFDRLKLTETFTADLVDHSY